MALWFKRLPAFYVVTPKYEWETMEIGIRNIPACEFWQVGYNGKIASQEAIHRTVVKMF